MDFLFLVVLETDTHFDEIYYTPTHELIHI